MLGVGSGRGAQGESSTIRGLIDEGFRVYSRNSLDPYYLVPHYYLGHIPSLFGSRWVVGYQVVGVLRVPRNLGA